VAVDGLAYFCPSIGYFGGDINVVTVRPTLRLVDENELFAQYFQYSGYDIELSDKVSYLKDTIERFGSLQATAEFFAQSSIESFLISTFIRKTQLMMM
jgi:hypothetical protein